MILRQAKIEILLHVGYLMFLQCNIVLYQYNKSTIFVGKNLTHPHTFPAKHKQQDERIRSVSINTLSDEDYKEYVV